MIEKAKQRDERGEDHVQGQAQAEAAQDSIIDGRAGSGFARTFLWSRAAAEALRETAPGWFWGMALAIILTLMLPFTLYLAQVDATMRVSGWRALVLLLGVCFSLAAGVGLVSLMMPLLRRLVRWQTGMDVRMDPGRRGTVLLLIMGITGTVLCCTVMRL